MAIEQSFIEELVARANIVEVVSSYNISLKKSGSNYFGLCPFHAEKSPSFSVSVDKQLFHCFGCSEGGGVITFIMKMENQSYVEAIKTLADMYHMEVLETGYSKEEDTDRKTILEMNKKTARFFYQNLVDPKNSVIQEYVKQRKISKKLAMEFGLGYANKNYNELLDFLTKEGYKTEQMLKAGLIGRSENGNLYDRFRGRLIFPIIDVTGNIIAFGGRVLDDSSPKYLNSPDTPVFNKKMNLFALNVARKSKKGYIILTEGYMDAISLHMAGFDCAVAALGTAFTENQARLLLRYTKDVVLAYDSDNAGQAASNRAIDILKKIGLNIKVLEMKNAKDPDEYIKKFGNDSFENLINKSENDTQYKFDKILQKYNLENDVQKIDCIKEIIKLLASLYNAVERDIYVNKACSATKVSKEAMKIEYDRYLSTIKKQNNTKTKRETMSPAKNIMPKTREITYEDVASARAEEEILCLIFTDCNLLDKIEVRENRFSVSFFRKVYEKAENLQKQGKQINISHLEENFETTQINHLTKIINRPQTMVNREEAFISCVDKMNERYAYRTNDLALITELKKKSRSV